MTLNLHIFELVVFEVEASHDKATLLVVEVIVVVDVKITFGATLQQAAQRSQAGIITSNFE